MGGRVRGLFLVSWVLMAMVGHRYSRRRMAGALALGLVPVVVIASAWAAFGHSTIAPHPAQAVLAVSTPTAQPAPFESPAPTPTAASSPAPTASAAPGSPYTGPRTANVRSGGGHSGPTIVARMLISEIHINMAVEAVGTTAHGEMGIPVNPNNAGWWQPGYAPGQNGHVVIDGHVNWYTGPGAFRDIHKLRQGDPINLAWAGGPMYTFNVTSSRTYPWNASVPDAFGPASRSTLVIITCAGTWDAPHHRYTQRLIVQAQLTSTA
jgi:hypothetical protein